MKTFILAIICSLALLSCESRDGEIEPMKWRMKPIPQRTDRIEVPREGGTYFFECKNYSSFWVYALQENGIDVKFEEGEANVTGTWSSADMIYKNMVRVTISPNESSAIRKLEVNVCTVSAFSSFIFYQNQ